MDINKIAIYALGQSSIAMASIRTLKDIVCDSAELKQAYREKYHKNIELQLTELEDVIDKDLVDKLQTLLKENNLL